MVTGRSSAIGVTLTALSLLASDLGVRVAHTEEPCASSSRSPHARTRDDRPTGNNP